MNDENYRCLRYVVLVARQDFMAPSIVETGILLHPCDCYLAFSYHNSRESAHLIAKPLLPNLKATDYRFGHSTSNCEYWQFAKSRDYGTFFALPSEVRNGDIDNAHRGSLPRSYHI